MREALRAGNVLGGEHWKRVPAPYAAYHPRADLLRHAGLFAGTRVPVPDEAFTPAFPEWCLERFRPLRPLQAWVAEVVEAVSLSSGGR